MAKDTRKVSMKGFYEHSDGIITEIKKEDVKVVNLIEILSQFDGEELSITITNDKEFGNNQEDLEDEDEEE
jgi:hypothetical protein